ncbi:NitT/TauT family transport system substrate-binding protein [Tessaracoccus bendigoensis DSM 12906]|uniref:NitT/TauT family transport system substrate-binding protein n=1 Tax=Tessaracoccus bendigoensis DSM 12906 TaxID=1123357 RepID=A0A1M6AXS1_9ACTN|nr:ABC transporter substrate-binding protein [Tessaracoccus bendigoensis]SHI41276.1 NitT/TauT family transport system substrate-binding protein [Tessaracoccus bendigoensis DSM 12906]
MIARRSFLLGSLVAGSALGLGACGRADPAATGGQLTVGLTYIPNVQFSAFYLGVDRGIFKDHGVDVTIRHHGEQEDVFGALLRGDEAVVFASADEAMVAAAGGQDIRSFATSYQTYPVQILGLDGTVALPSNPLEVLAGHSLGIPGHYGSSYFAALCAIHQAGLTVDDVELVDIGYTAISALETEKVDFIAGFRNNELVQLASRGGSPLAIPVMDDNEPRLVGPSLITKGDTVADATLRALADGMAEAEQAVIDDPEAALDATAKQVPALSDPGQREAAAAVLKATSELWLRDGKVDVGIDIEAFARMGDFLTEAGVIEQAPQNPYRVV